MRAIFASVTLLFLMGCTLFEPPKSDREAYSPEWLLIHIVSGLARYPCVSIASVPGSLTFYQTSVGTYSALAEGQVSAGGTFRLNSTSTNLAGGYSIVAIPGSGCAVSGSNEGVAALGNCTNTATQISCPVVQSGRFVFRFESGVRSTDLSVQ